MESPCSGFNSPRGWVWTSWTRDISPATAPDRSCSDVLRNEGADGGRWDPDASINFVW